MTESGDLFETLDKEQSTSPSERYIEYDIATYPSSLSSNGTLLGPLSSRLDS